MISFCTQWRCPLTPLEQKYPEKENFHLHIEKNVMKNVILTFNIIFDFFLLYYPTFVCSVTWPLGLIHTRHFDEQYCDKKIWGIKNVFDPLVSICQGKLITKFEVP